VYVNIPKLNKVFLYLYLYKKFLCIPILFHVGIKTFYGENRASRTRNDNDRKYRNQHFMRKMNGHFVKQTLIAVVVTTLWL
jgi:hypothetical protein